MSAINLSITILFTNANAKVKFLILDLYFAESFIHHCKYVVKDPASYAKMMFGFFKSFIKNTSAFFIICRLHFIDACQVFEMEIISIN